MNKLFDLDRAFEYENGFYATASPARFSKFVTHLEFFRMTSELRGEIVEFGVFKGNSLFRWIKFRDLLEQTNSRKVIGFDAFGAFPETDFEQDKERRNAFISETGGGVGISMEELNDLLEKQGLRKNVDLIGGDIMVTLDEYLEKHPYLKVSLLHIDVDIFEPTKYVLDRVFDHVVTGGVIVLDDYGAFAGANKAIDEFFESKRFIKKLPYSNAIAYVVK